MKHKTLTQLFLGALAIVFCQLVTAANIDISDIDGVDSDKGQQIVKTTYGVWVDNGKIYFDEAGTYTMQLTDLSFAETYEHVGAMISTTTESIAKIELKNGDPIDLNPISFVVEEGEYWLSFFAIANSNSNVGTFGFDVAAAVPLPPAALFMGTALLGLVSFSRQRKQLQSRS